MNQDIKGTHGILVERPQIHTRAEKVLVAKVKHSEQNCAALANGGVAISHQFKLVQKPSTYCLEALTSKRKANKGRSQAETQLQY